MKRLIALAGLLLALTPAVLAFGGPDGIIDTYFDASGVLPYFESELVLNGGDDYVIENVWTGLGSVTVLENIDLEDHSFFCFEWADANVDKQIWVDPWFGKAHVEKAVVWDGVGEVYREAFLGDDIVDIKHAGTLLGDATFVDNIEYKGDLYVYESVGLNRGATCEIPEMPDFPEQPECGWC